MIKYAHKQDRRTFAEKHSIAFFVLIGLAAAIALNSFHHRTQNDNSVKSPKAEILKIVSDIRSNH